MLHWQRAKHDRIQQCEDCRVGANAQRERDDGNHRETWRLTELAQSELNVLQNRFEPHRSSALPAVFFDLIDATKLEPCEPARITLRDARSHFGRDLRIE